MTISLDHTIVPANDKLASAKFFAEIFGLPCGEPVGPFVPVPINERLTFDFDDRRKPVEVHHYAFHVSPSEFDAVFGRVQAKGLKYGSGPFSNENMQVGEFNGGRTVYFRELSGHLIEIRTKTSAEDIAAMRRAH
jgi:catechol 2,3-dioxygenase-like lactoylglutathione lyase family enzyme